jgi:nicotinate-nucleotide pyrophosphorylase (carboxylating)
MLDLTNFIQQAISEDVGTGDHSSLSCIDAQKKGKATLLVKESCVLAGVEVAQQIFKHLESNAVFTAYIEEGVHVESGSKAFTIEATIHTILKAERLVLNSMQRMSGIATLTRIYVDQLSGFKTRLLDTRKTTPNFRLLEKEAVRIGGGTNHRFGLYDMIMLKDNHIDYCGSIASAIQRANAYRIQNKLPLLIEVETRNLDEVQQVLNSEPVDRIMLDNFHPDQIREAIRLIDGRIETEASGGITLDNLKDYAATGVDYISSGALIHQARSVDLSLKASFV